MIAFKKDILIIKYGMVWFYFWMKYMGSMHCTNPHHIILSRPIRKRNYTTRIFLDELYGKDALELTSAYHIVETYFAKKGHKLYTPTYMEALNNDNM